MTTTTPAGSTGTLAYKDDRARADAAAVGLLGLADVIAAVGAAPLNVEIDRPTGQVTAHVYDLAPWLTATGVPAPVVYTPDGYAMWASLDRQTLHTISPVGRQGFALRHIDLSRVEAGV